MALQVSRMEISVKLGGRKNINGQRRWRVGANLSFQSHGRFSVITPSLFLFLPFSSTVVSRSPYSRTSKLAAVPLPPFAVRSAFQLPLHV